MALKTNKQTNKQTNSYLYLKDDGLVVFLEVESKHVSVFKRVSAQTQNIYSLSKKLNLKGKYTLPLITLVIKINRTYCHKNWKCYKPQSTTCCVVASLPSSV